MGSERKTVLVTGATGFIGGRLVKALLAEGYRVRCLVRRPETPLPVGCEKAYGDLLERTGLDKAFAGVDAAYYLIHSMAAGKHGFQERDRQAAENFVATANRTGLRRAIYLGGLGDADDSLSEHLASRLEVAGILASGNFQTTFLRAAVIIGAGGASFEIIKALVERFPVIVAPRQVSTRCQPIAVENVIRYLIGSLQEELTAGETFDIGGPEVLSYREMLKRFAGVKGKRISIIPVPLLSTGLSSCWARFIAPVTPSVSIPLIEGLKNEVICRDQRIRDILPFPLTSYDEAVRTALAEGERFPLKRDQVYAKYCGTFKLQRR